MSELETLEEFERLAKLSQVEYDRQRKDAAKRLKLRLMTLDAKVAELLPNAAARPGSTRGQHPGGETSGGALAPPPPEPWPDEVDGGALLDQICKFIGRFIVVSHHALVALTLWIVFTYLLDVAVVSPRLAIISPTMRCGKTLVLNILLLLAWRPLTAANISPAALFRAIDLEHPSLLIDEADAMPQGSERGEEIRGILNSGHTPEQAYVVRNIKIGDDWGPKRFSTWAPIAVAAIGKLPGTWMDRSIVIPMKRKPPGRRVERLTRNTAAREQAVELSRKIARWTTDHKATIAVATPKLPEILDDRALDNWDPLNIIANVAGNRWPKYVWEAALELSKNRSESDSMGEQLLADVKEIFDEQRSDCPASDQKISSKDLCSALHSMEGRPWGEWGRRVKKPISQTQLANLLKHFGIVPGSVRLSDGSTPKGYYRKDFEEAFASYVPPPHLPDHTPPPKHSADPSDGEANNEGAPYIPDPNRHGATPSGAVGGNGDFQGATDPPCGGSRNGSSPYAQKGCGGVADQNGEYDGATRTEAYDDDSADDEEEIF